VVGLVVGPVAALSLMGRNHTANALSRSRLAG
jgi:hypothetical protein